MSDNATPIEGNWRGRAQYRCRICGWDTIEGRDAFIAHFRDAHPPLEVIEPDQPRSTPTPARRQTPKKGDS